VAWILGAWCREDEADRLNELLALGSELDGWKREFRSLKPRPGIGEYWSLVWQLQIAEFLTGLGADVRWQPRGGPDLLARRGSEPHYIECYCPTKAWGIECFLTDLVIKTDPKLSVSRVRNLRSPFACSSDAEIESLLDRALSPLLDELWLAECRRQAECRYPVMVYDAEQHGHRFSIVMEGTDARAYYPPADVPGKGAQNKHGTPAISLQNYLEEFTRNKEAKNKMELCRPNLLAMNARGLDWQLALGDGTRTESVLSALPLPAWLDGILLTGCGTACNLAQQAPRIVPLNHSLLSWL
jgi:hypothetical protein